MSSIPGGLCRVSDRRHGDQAAEMPVGTAFSLGFDPCKRGRKHSIGRPTFILSTKVLTRARGDGNTTDGRCCRRSLHGFDPCKRGRKLKDAAGKSHSTIVLTRARGDGNGSPSSRIRFRVYEVLTRARGDGNLEYAEEVEKEFQVLTRARGDGNPMETIVKGHPNYVLTRARGDGNESLSDASFASGFSF